MFLKNIKQIRKNRTFCPEMAFLKKKSPYSSLMRFARPRRATPNRNLGYGSGWITMLRWRSLFIWYSLVGIYLGPSKSCSLPIDILGPPGIPGAKGHRGNSGRHGIHGIPGNPGIVGDPGARGRSGRPGVPGPRGADGNRGAKGLRGAHGAPGATGSKLFSMGERHIFSPRTTRRNRASRFDGPRRRSRTPRNGRNQSNPFRTAFQRNLGPTRDGRDWWVSWE